MPYKYRQARNGALPEALRSQLADGTEANAGAFASSRLGAHAEKLSIGPPFTPCPIADSFEIGCHLLLATSLEADTLDALFDAVEDGSLDVKLAQEFGVPLDVAQFIAVGHRGVSDVPIASLLLQFGVSSSRIEISSAMSATVRMGSAPFSVSLNDSGVLVAPHDETRPKVMIRSARDGFSYFARIASEASDTISARALAASLNLPFESVRYRYASEGGTFLIRSNDAIIRSVPDRTTPGMVLVSGDVDDVFPDSSQVKHLLRLSVQVDAASIYESHSRLYRLADRPPGIGSDAEFLVVRRQLREELESLGLKEPSFSVRVKPGDVNAEVVHASVDIAGLRYEVLCDRAGRMAYFIGDASVSADEFAARSTRARKLANWTDARAPQMRQLAEAAWRGLLG